MSGIMKVFFDRITDLITIEKDLGRQLRGKKMAAICCSNGDDLNKKFWIPFQESAKYLGMDYIGNLHSISNQIDKTALTKFINNIEKI